MKKIILGLIAVFALSWTAIAQEINWVTLEEALELQKKSLKKFLWMYIPTGVVHVKC